MTDLRLITTDNVLTPQDGFAEASWIVKGRADRWGPRRRTDGDCQARTERLFEGLIGPGAVEKEPEGVLQGLLSVPGRHYHGIFVWIRRIHNVVDALAVRPPRGEVHRSESDQWIDQRGHFCDRS